MLAAMTESPQLKASPRRNDLLTLIEGEQHGSAGEALPADLLEEFMAAGDTASCGTTVDRLLEAGADRVVLVPNPAGFRSTSTMVEQMRAAGSLTGGRSVR